MNAVLMPTGLNGSLDNYCDESLDPSTEPDQVQEFCRNYPIASAVALAAVDSAVASVAIGTTPGSWGFFGAYKVVTMAGKAVGGILGGAYGACSAIKEAAFGENGASWESAKRSISDYAVRGANDGFLGTDLPVIGIGLWAGFKVTVIALPVLKVAVPVAATLGALGAIEYAVRGESYIQSGLGKVIIWLSPSNYFKSIFEEYKEIRRETEIPGALSE